MSNIMQWLKRWESIDEPPQQNAIQLNAKPLAELGRKMEAARKTQSNPTTRACRNCGSRNCCVAEKPGHEFVWVECFDCGATGPNAKTWEAAEKSWNDGTLKEQAEYNILTQQSVNDWIRDTVGYRHEECDESDCEVCRRWVAFDQLFEGVA